MSLLHTVLGSHLAAMGTPLPGPWPAGTVLTAHDVLVDGVSLTTTAGVAATPFVLSGRRAVAPLGFGGDPATLLRSILVVRVDTVVPRRHGLPRQVWVDADLSGCAPVARETRLVGRWTDARQVPVALRPGHADGGHELARLPEDVHIDDLLVVPCLGAVSPADVAP